MLNTLRQWKSIDQAPPITEVEALRYVNEGTEDKELKAVLYTALAYHRMKRHPGEDPLADQFIDEARRLEGSHSLVTDLYESKQLMKAYAILKETPLEQWILHETDHDSAKAKKVKSIYEDVQEVISQWNHELAEKTLLDVSSRLKIYQDIYNELEELKEMLEEAIHSIENRRIRVPVKEVNERTRQLSDKQDDIHRAAAGVSYGNSHPESFGSPGPDGRSSGCERLHPPLLPLSSISTGTEELWLYDGG